MKNSSIQFAEISLEAPIALTPDQIAMVAAGSTYAQGHTATSGMQQGYRVIADDLAVKTNGKAGRD